MRHRLFRLRLDHGTELCNSRISLQSHSGSGAMTDEEAFSDFNPFQSGGEGSSPAPNRASTASRAARRKVSE